MISFFNNKVMHALGVPTTCSWSLQILSDSRYLYLVRCHLAVTPDLLMHIVHFVMWSVCSERASYAHGQRSQKCRAAYADVCMQSKIWAYTWTWADEYEYQFDRKIWKTFFATSWTFETVSNFSSVAPNFSFSVALSCRMEVWLQQQLQTECERRESVMQFSLTTDMH